MVKASSLSRDFAPLNEVAARRLRAALVQTVLEPWSARQEPSLSSSESEWFIVPMANPWTFLAGGVDATQAVGIVSLHNRLLALMTSEHIDVVNVVPGSASVVAGRWHIVQEYDPENLDEDPAESGFVCRVVNEYGDDVATDMQEVVARLVVLLAQYGPEIEQVPVPHGKP